MNKEPNENAAVAASATRPISVQLTDPLPGDRMADPIRDHAPQVRSRGKVDRLMRLLDSLESENPNRRWKR